MAVSLASWRLAALLMYEAGPWNVVRALREFAGVTHDDEGRPVGIPEDMPGAVFGCIYCMTIWTGGAMLAAWSWAPIVVWLLAASGLAIIVGLAAERLNNG